MNNRKIQSSQPNEPVVQKPQPVSDSRQYNSNTNNSQPTALPSDDPWFGRNSKNDTMKLNLSESGGNHADDRYNNDKEISDANFHTNFNNDVDEANSDANLFAMTSDMEQAMRELELRKKMTEFDEYFDYENNLPPEYDVREKLETLNAQLANEPLPPDPEHRNSRVVFSQELISLVAPPDPQDYSTASDDEVNYDENIRHDSVQRQDSVTDDDLHKYERTSIENTNSQSYEQSEEGESIETKPKDIKFNESNEQPSQYEKFDENQTNAESKDDEILVNRNGEYQLMGADDMIGLSDQVASDDANSNIKKPRPSNRPTSAPATKRNRLNDSALSSSSGSVRSENEFRSSSMMTFQNQNNRNSNSNQIPRVDRNALKRQKERQEKLERERQERIEADKEEKRAANESIFMSWLKKKQIVLREEHEQLRKQEEDEQKKRNEHLEQKRISVKEKEKQLQQKIEEEKRREEKMRQYRNKEIEDSCVIHSQDECEKAYKDWLKRKQREHKQKQREERQKARITRLAMRPSRKSQSLAQAIHEASVFRF